MNERICNQGHVLDAEFCSRCGSPEKVVSTQASLAPALARREEVKARGEEKVVKSPADVKAERSGVVNVDEVSVKNSSATNLENFEELSVGELKAELTAREIKFTSEDHKADLQKKLRKALKREVL